MPAVTPINIVIVGGGTAGWMVAAAFAKLLSNNYRVQLVESDQIGTIGVGEATIPMIQNFNAVLGLDEAAFLHQTKGSYKLGIAFEGWGSPDDHYTHGFGLVGKQWQLLPFHHYWLRARALGVAKPLGDYLLNTITCASNRFAHVTRDEGATLPTMPFAFHFDAGFYAQMLRDYAEARGVVRHQATIRHVERDPVNGGIAALHLENGGQVAGDFFIDCSGFRGLLIEQTLAAGYDDWSHWLPCDRAVAVPCAHGPDMAQSLTPYTRSIARKAGWQWRIPLQHRIGNGHVFSTRYMSEDEATAILLDNLDGEALAEPRSVSFTAGRRRKAWSHNVVAVGLASGFLEPLESTSIHLIQTAIDRLLKLLPDNDQQAWPVLAAQYNAQSRIEMERIRDFIILHYHANGRTGEPLWDACRAMAIPDTLRQKIDLFRARGLFIREDEELFTEEGWVQVMIGQGIIPSAYHPLVHRLPDKDVVELLDIITTAYHREAHRFPVHHDYVQRMTAIAAKQMHQQGETARA